MRVFFASELEGVATFWRIYRQDGVALGFTSHNRALSFGGIRHSPVPGMLPSAIRRTADLSSDSAEVEGVLSHSAISAEDLEAGLYDDAFIESGPVDWETLEYAILYAGSLGRVVQTGHGFTAELRSTKSLLEEDLVPRVSPTCRAQFCGPGCNLSAPAYSARTQVTGGDLGANSVTVAGIAGAELIDGRLRFESGPQAGIEFGIVNVTGAGLTLDRPLSAAPAVGTMVALLEGCDHTIEACIARFANGLNFRGEPYLPGNDLLARYANPK